MFLVTVVTKSVFGEGGGEPLPPYLDKHRRGHVCLKHPNE